MISPNRSDESSVCLDFASADPDLPIAPFGDSAATSLGAELLQPLTMLAELLSSCSRMSPIAFVAIFSSPLARVLAELNVSRFEMIELVPRLCADRGASE
jgi:hypothetical protein